jgi:DNA uptake protein ComE-like DNA-binding protein
MFMSRVIRSAIMMALVGAGGCASAPPASAAAHGALTTEDVDLAPECAGLLAYASTASLATLDAYLPSNVAQAIVAIAAIDPFASIADLLAVNGVGPSRLQQLLAHARSDGFVGVTCDGIYDELGVSQDDAAAIVGFVNDASESELAGVLSFLPFPGATLTNLLAGRPFANVATISGISGVGPATFRALRNAACQRGPFEDLVEVVNSIDHPDGQVRILRHFDWREVVANERLTSLICFGIDPAELPPGATIRDELADGAEVHTNVTQTVATADRFDEVSAQIDPAIGLADLQARTAQLTFFGCFVRSSPNPFVFDHQDFFIDVNGRFAVLTSIHAVE